MSFKAFPFKGTFLAGTVFLAVFFGHVVFRSEASFLLSALFMLCFFLYTLRCLGNALVKPSKVEWQRALLAVLFLALFIPIGRAGNSLRNQIFLSRLSSYQKVIDQIVVQERKKSATFSESVDWPSDFPGFLVAPHTLVSCDADNRIIALFFTQDSSALGHDGYLYCSDDDLDKLKQERPSTGFAHLAPHWYAWSN